MRTQTNLHEQDKKAVQQQVRDKETQQQDLVNDMKKMGTEHESALDEIRQGHKADIQKMQDAIDEVNSEKDQLEKVFDEVKEEVNAMKV